MKQHLLPHVVLVMSLGHGSLVVAQPAMAPAGPEPQNPSVIADARPLHATVDMVTIERRWIRSAALEPCDHPSRTRGTVPRTLVADLPRCSTFGLEEAGAARFVGSRSVMQSRSNGVSARGKNWKRIIAGIAVAGAGAYFVSSARADTIAISEPRYCFTFEPLLGRTVANVCGRNEYRQPVEGSEKRQQTLGWVTVGAGAPFPERLRTSASSARDEIATCDGRVNSV